MNYEEITKTYIQPMIQYGILVYACTSRRSLESIHLIQKRNLRLINFMSPRESTEELFTRHRIPKIYEICMGELIKFCLKVLRKELTVNSLNELSVGK